MIASFRKFTTSIFAKIFIFLIAGSFIFLGIGDLIRNKAYQDDYLTIGEKKFSKAYVDNATKSEEEKIRRLYPDNPNLNNIPFAKIAMQKILIENLLLQEADKVDLLLTNKAIIKDITNTADFLTNSKFDQVKFDNFLAKNNLKEAEFLAILRKQKKIDILKDISSLKINQSLKNTAKIIAQIENQDKIFDLYKLSHQPGSTINVTEQEIAEYYHKQQDKYKIDTQRDISFIDLSCANFIEKVKVSKSEIEQEYNYLIQTKDFAEKRDLELLTFQKQEQAQKALKLLQNNKTMQQTAKLLGVSVTSLNRLAKEEIFADFKERVFSKKKGEYTQILTGEFGHNIFYIKEIIKPKKADLAALRAEIITRLSKAKACEEAILTLNKIEPEIDSGASLEELANKYELTLEKNTNLSTKNLKEFAKQLKISTAQGISALQNIFADNNGPARISKISNEQYLIHRTNNITPEYILPLKQVEKQIAATIKNDKIKEKLIKQANDYIKQLNQDKIAPSLANLTIRRNLKLSENYEQEFIANFVSQIYKLPKGYFTSFYFDSKKKQLIFLRSVSTSYASKISSFKQNEAEAKIGELLNNLVSESYFRYLESSYPINIREENAQ